MFITTIDGVQRTATIEKVLYVPGLGTNLLSIAAVTDVGVTVNFVKSNVYFTLNNIIVMKGERTGRTLYHLAIIPTTQEETA